jgi:hypothetical protein
VLQDLSVIDIMYDEAIKEFFFGQDYLVRKMMRCIKYNPRGDEMWSGGRGDIYATVLAESPLRSARPIAAISIPA